MRNRSLLIIASFATVFTLGSLAYAGATSNTVAPTKATAVAQQNEEQGEREHKEQVERERAKGKGAQHEQKEQTRETGSEAD